MKESEKKYKYRDLVREHKSMKHEDACDTNGNLCAQYNPKWLVRGLENLEMRG